jgi:pimeloyl-ACP methyl ester carboxylesterase
MAARHPDLVAGVVVLDAPVLLPRAARRALGLLLTALPRRLWPTALRRFMIATFTATDDPAWRAEVLDRLAGTDPMTARALVRETFAFDGRRSLAALTVPALCVRANIPTPLYRLPDGVAGAEISGAGHWVHVHRPAEVAALLRNFRNAPDGVTAGSR